MLVRVLLTLALLPLGGTALAQMPSELKGHKGLVYTLAFSPDGKLLATGSFDATVKLWDWPAGKELHTLQGHTAPIYCVAFSPDGTLLASASQDKTIRLWDPKAGKLLRELKGHGDIVDSVAFSPDGKLLASASADKSVRLWNPADGKEVKKLGNHKGSVYCVAFSADGKWLASCSQDTTIKLWDVKGQKEAAVLTPIAPREVPKKKDMKKGGAPEVKKDIKDTKKETKKEEAKKDMTVPVPEVPEPVTVVLFSPDNARLFSAGFDRFLREWSMADHKPLTKLGPTEDDIFGLALARDGKRVATAGYGGHLHVWEWSSGKEEFKTHLKKMVTYCVAFTPDGRALVTGHERDNVVLITPLVPQPIPLPPPPPTKK